jgi:hypothetical protein
LACRRVHRAKDAPLSQEPPAAAKFTVDAHTAMALQAVEERPE